MDLPPDAEASLAQALVDAVLEEGPSAANRARLALQRDGTPEEVRAAWRARARFPRPAREWIERLHDYTFWEEDAPRPFLRTSRSDWLAHFQGPDGPRGRELLVGFTGAVGNLLQPAPVVLQRLDVARHDLVLVRDPERSSYRGRVGPHEDFASLLAILADTAAPYASVMTLGASMGGLTALRAGVALGARRAVSVGGRRSAPDPVALAGGRLPRAGSTEIACLFAEQHVADREAALATCEELPDAAAIAIVGMNQHNVAHRAFLEGSLAAYFALVVDGVSSGDVITRDPVQPVTTVQLPANCEPPRWAKAGTVDVFHRRRPRLERIVASRPAALLADGIRRSPRARSLVGRVATAALGRRVTVRPGSSRAAQHPGG